MLSFKPQGTSHSDLSRNGLARATFLTILLWAWQTPWSPYAPLLPARHKVNTRGSAWCGQLPPYKAFIDPFIHPSIHQAFTDCLQKAITGFVIDVRHSEQKQASPCPHRLYDLVGKIGIDQITTLYKKEEGPMSRQNQGTGRLL